MIQNRNARRFVVLSLAAFLGCCLVGSESQAQLFRRHTPGQELGRFLGLGYGNGYHCRTPGPQADYYNPWSAKNSHLVSRYNTGPFSNLNTGYAVGGTRGYVPHSVYAGSQPSPGESVFESLPGQSVKPTFEPVPERRNQLQNDLEDEEYQNEVFERNQRSRNEDNSFGSGLHNEPGSNNRSDFDDGGFDSLRENFDSLREGGSDSKTPGQQDQASFFGS